jgi:RNA polymerase sigma-70 factor (ECF subfamily)
MQYINDRDSVEDIVQDIFVMLWTEAPNLKIQISLKSYLFTSVKNSCLDFRKHQKVIEKFRTYSLYTSECGSDTTDHMFSESELRNRILKCLVKLPPRCREIFELSRSNYLSNKDISEKLNISKRTVELQISNALKIFRKELSEFLPVWVIAFLIGS